MQQLEAQDPPPLGRLAATNSSDGVMDVTFEMDASYDSYEYDSPRDGIEVGMESLPVREEQEVVDEPIEEDDEEGPPSLPTALSLDVNALNSIVIIL